MSIEYDDLVDAQRDVAESTDATLLVLGGAGTGKTTTALWAARRELERSDQAPSEGDRARARALFLTFSRTAVARVVERAGGVVSGKIGRRIEVMTFHGFAYRLICDFGRYAGAGRDTPVIRGTAETNLLGSRPGDVQYDDLVPRALQLLRSPMIGRLLRSRWPLVICDEFQDTSDEQWELLESLGETARLLLLGDPNQMIYQWIPGVGTHRLEAARSRRGCVEITLPRNSQRDPSQILPAAAEAILRGEHSHPDVRAAVAQDRMRIYAPVPTPDGTGQVMKQIELLRKEKLRSVGVFVRENSFVEELCDQLSTSGVGHTPVGMSESYGQALRAQATMIAACMGDSDWTDVCRELAVYLASVVRGRVPEAARRLLHGQADSRALQERLDLLQTAITSADRGNLQAAAALAGRSWLDLSMTRGQRTWQRTAVALRPLVAAADKVPAGRTQQLLSAVEGLRTTATLETGDLDTAIVQVMTVNQAKGREADGTILWGRSDDYYGPAHDWRANGPRLLYVTLTRARRRAVLLLLPHDPHPLLRPLLVHATAPDAHRSDSLG